MHFTNDPHDVHYKGAKLGHFFKTSFSLSLVRISFSLSLEKNAHCSDLSLSFEKNAHGSEKSRCCSAHHGDHWLIICTKGFIFTLTKRKWEKS